MKVGDRITIASVTGDVIDVGLVRFYMMELAGSGTELNPTGRVAVFSNAVLFQAGTPLYKQIPGTEYAWHELIVKLTDGANYKLVCEAILKEVHAVFEEYRPRRFPVQIRKASETDEKLTRALIELISKTPDIKSAVASTPVIQASVRG